MSLEEIWTGTLIWIWACVGTQGGSNTNNPAPPLLRKADNTLFLFHIALQVSPRGVPSGATRIAYSKASNLNATFHHPESNTMTSTIFKRWKSVETEDIKGDGSWPRIHQPRGKTSCLWETRRLLFRRHLQRSCGFCLYHPLFWSALPACRTPESVPLQVPACPRPCS